MSAAGRFGPPPRLVVWRFAGVRTGWERARITAGSGRIRATGVSRGVDADEGIPWRIAYDVRWDHRWRFQRALVRSRDVVRRVERADAGGWRIDGKPRAEFADCIDLDLQVSLLTNTAPAHRFATTRRTNSAPAVYLTSTLDIVQIDQVYRRLPGAGARFDYDSPDHGYRAILSFAADGFVTDYPFIGRRHTATSSPERSR